MLQAFKVKILMLGEDESPQAVRVELSSEADLFFHYVHDLDEHGFAVRRQEAGRGAVCVGGSSRSEREQYWRARLSLRTFAGAAVLGGWVGGACR